MEAPGPPEARAASSAPRPGPEVEGEEVGVIEEALEETEEVEEASVIEGAEADSEGAGAINTYLSICLSYLYFTVFNDDDDDLKDNVTSCEHFQKTLVSPRHIFKVQLPKLLQQTN